MINTMIRVTYKQDGARHALTVKGHAGEAPAGQDIVCAGVSAIVQALGGVLRLMSGHGDVRPLVIRMDSGDAEIAAEGGEADAVFLMALVGLEQVRMAYPERISIGISPA